MRYIIICLIFGFCGCSSPNNRLNLAPTPIPICNNTLAWDRSELASFYQVKLDDKTYTTKKTEFSIAFLKPGTYTVQVRAVNMDGASDWISLEFRKF